MELSRGENSSFNILFCSFKPSHDGKEFHHECVCGGVRVCWGVFMLFFFLCFLVVLHEKISSAEKACLHTQRNTHAHLCVHKHTLRLEGTNKPLEGPILEKYNKAIVTLRGGHT